MLYQSPKTIFRTPNEDFLIEEINWIALVEEFEKKFEIKVENSNKILIAVY
jgi:hypothetical protein